uniref:Uncharacterized protein n=1 Tax=Sinocyclocheilus grahami TaxID=75366 RepID=A0A672PFB8_SINGR
VACGQDHSLFLTDRGSVYACGWGADGQTGLGHHSKASCPVPVGGDLAGVKVQQVATYGDCSLAVSTEGQVFGWGNSEYLQLASVTEATQMSSPRLLPLRGVGRVRQAACGGTQVAVLNGKITTHPGSSGTITAQQTVHRHTSRFIDPPHTGLTNPTPIVNRSRLGLLDRLIDRQIQHTVTKRCEWQDLSGGEGAVGVRKALPSSRAHGFVYSAHFCSSKSWLFRSDVLQYSVVVGVMFRD